MPSKHIVVLGAGFGGLEFCKAFRHPDARITLVDRHNHHLFQPLLYQVATAGLSMPEIAQPIRSILSERRDITVLLDEATDIRLAEKAVVLKNETLHYDYLLLALGAVTSYFGHEEWERHAHGLKSLDDASAIRRDVLLAFERAESCNDPQEQKKLMTSVVIGGGPTGVELAGAFAELTRHVLKRDFRRINPAEARVVLVEAAPKVLVGFPDPLPDKARRQLEKLGVEVRTSSPVKEIGPGYVRLENEALYAANIVWAAGVMAHPITRSLDVDLDRAGRIKIRPDCSLPGYPEAFAVGDIAWLVDARQRTVPGVSPAAMQMARHVARIIKTELMGAPCVPTQRPAFSYFDKGSMATIGRSAAVAVIGKIQLTGWFAWLAWLFVHLIFLVGLRNKLAVLLQWFYSYVRYKRGARIITGELPDKFFSTRLP